MLIEEQVCSFDQASLIYSHGLRLDNCLLHWCQNKHTEQNKLFLAEISPPTYGWVYLFPAYTVAELGVLLGDWLYHIRVDIGLCDNDETTGFCNFCFAFENEEFEYFKTEAQARAGALIWLIENNHLKPEDLKL
jgi:hypothetical protein